MLDPSDRCGHLSSLRTPCSALSRRCRAWLPVLGRELPMRTVAKVQPTYYQESRLLLVKLQPTFPPRVAACSRLAAPAAASRVTAARRSRAHPLRCVHTCLQAAARPDPGAGTRPAAACHVRACLRAAGVLRSGYVDVQSADTEQPIAAPAWQSYGTRPPLRYLCVLRTVTPLGADFAAGTGHSARAGGSRHGHGGPAHP